METIEGGYKISDDKASLSPDRVLALLSKTYWATGRTIECMFSAIENSACYGVYDGASLIGFARVVTDKATMYYIADVVIDEEHRGRGLGKRLIGFITGQDAYKNLTGMLLTRDAHGLYEHYGFMKEPNVFMMKKRV